MAVNKVVYGTNTLLDLTGDTVVADVLLQGYTAHSKAGVAVDGTLVIQNFYTGTSAPSDSVGSNGDLYLRTGA